MLTILMAWRNVWRNPRRTWLTVLAIALAVGLLNFGYAYFLGVTSRIYATSLEEEGQVRIVARKYAVRERLLPLEEALTVDDQRLEAIARVPGVDWVGRRVAFGGLLDVHDRNTVALGLGLDDGDARDGYHLDRKLVAGRLPAASGEVVIGRVIVDRLHARLGDELTLVTRSAEGSTAAANLKVVGIANLGGGILSRRFFVRFPDAQKWLRMPGQATMLVIAGGRIGREHILIEHLGRARVVRPGELAQAWQDHGLFAGAYTVIQVVLDFITAIIMTVAAMGVISPMFVAVMERTREFGVMMALGVTGRRILSGVLLEALLTGLVGGFLGVAWGSACAAYFAHFGLALGPSITKLALPIPSVIYPVVSGSDTFSAFAIGVGVAAIGAIWPAWRAARLDPVVAMRSH